MELGTKILGAGARAGVQLGSFSSWGPAVRRETQQYDLILSHPHSQAASSRAMLAGGTARAAKLGISTTGPVGAAYLILSYLILSHLILSLSYLIILVGVTRR